MATDSNQKLTIPLKTRIYLTVLSTFIDYSIHPDGSINRRLLRFFDFRTPPNPKPIDSVSTSDFVVDPSRNLWFRLFTPHDVVSGRDIPVVIFFHGGGFVYLSPDSCTYDYVCRRFARSLSAYVICVNYRLAPEHRYPAQYDDGFDVLKFLDGGAGGGCCGRGGGGSREGSGGGQGGGGGGGGGGQGGGGGSGQGGGGILPANADLTKCFLVGDSAGGNIAHNVAVRFCRSRRDFAAVKLAGLISIQPFFGGEERTEAEKSLVGMPLVSPQRTDWCWKVLLPEGSNRNHEAANPMATVDISGIDFPETVVVVAGFDPLKDWQRKYCEWIKLSGIRVKLIEYPNMFHAFYVFPDFPESDELIIRIKDFVKERVASLST